MHTLTPEIWALALDVVADIVINKAFDVDVNTMAGYYSQFRIYDPIEEPTQHDQPSYALTL
jgi:hypothetical protein